MFDLSKLKISVNCWKDFNSKASIDEIEELDKYTNYRLPKIYKDLLRNYNGGDPELKYFNVNDDIYDINYFFSLGEKKDSAINIWWAIENFSSFTGADTLPFAMNGINEIYFFKWLGSKSEIWIFKYDELDEPESYFVIDSFEKLLSSLYD